MSRFPAKSVTNATLDPSGDTAAAMSPGRAWPSTLTVPPSTLTTATLAGTWPGGADGPVGEGDPGWPRPSVSDATTATAATRATADPAATNFHPRPAPAFRLGPARGARANGRSPAPANPAARP